MSKNNTELIVGLDIGTTKIVALIAEEDEEGEVHLIGSGVHPSFGLKRGVVVNIESTMQSIRRAIEEAELMAGCSVKKVVAGIAGSHVRSMNSHGIVAIRDKEVRQSDVENVVDAAKAVAIPSDQEILHVLPQTYTVDDQEGIRDPIGMSGVRLETSVHIVTGSVCAAQNIVKCIERCDLHVGDIVLEQLASSCVLTDDEKDLGVCMIDIGGGTTDIALFANGAIQHTGVIPIAGSQVTNDIAVAMRIPNRFAEQLKLLHASLLPLTEEESVAFDMGDGQTKMLSRNLLVDVVRARYEELFGMVKSAIRRSGFESLVVSGIVLTGGASKIEGAAALAESIFQVPVRIGMPQRVKGIKEILSNPIFATSVGLLLHAYYMQCRDDKESALLRGARGVMQRMTKWFAHNF